MRVDAARVVAAHEWSFERCRATLRLTLEASAPLQTVCKWGSAPAQQYRLGDLLQWPWAQEALRNTTLEQALSTNPRNPPTPN